MLSTWVNRTDDFSSHIYFYIGMFEIEFCILRPNRHTPSHLNFLWGVTFPENIIFTTNYKIKPSRDDISEKKIKKKLAAVAWCLYKSRRFIK